MAKHVSLIGMMGSGKSTVAPLVAERLKRPIMEVDRLIEKQEGLPIGEIFTAKGEAYFRRAERDLIAGLVDQPPSVLSLGGGAFQWDGTRELLLERTVVFYLSTAPEVLCARLRSATTARPLLSTPGIDLEATIRELLKRREIYYDLAHYRVQTDYHDPAQVAQAIVTMREAYD